MNSSTSNVRPLPTAARRLAGQLFVALVVAPQIGSAQGFDKLNTTMSNTAAALVAIAVVVVTIAIMWAGFKMIFQAARLTDVANILFGGTLIGGASAFAAYIVN